MNFPMISVIIPNYNYSKYISKAVDSVLSQTYPNVEVIVVDDGSRDDSLDILKTYGNEIKVLKQKNQGVSAARNSGAEASSGEFVAFLDADDIWLPKKLERQMRKFDNDKELGLVHCSMSYIDPHDRILGENRDGMEGFVASELLRFERGVVIGTGSTSLVPKTIFDELGGFDLRMTTAADWDFSYRLGTKYKIGFISEPMVLYRMHDSNMHGNIGAMEHDMMLGFAKAFSNGTAENSRKCYGNLHKILAGSFLRTKQYKKFFQHAAMGIWKRPSTFWYFCQFPVRWFRRRKIENPENLRMDLHRSKPTNGMSNFLANIDRRFRKLLFVNSWDTGWRNTAVAAVFRKRIGPKTTILDVGCGNFGIAHFLPSTMITGVDIVVPAVQDADFAFLQGSILSLPFPERSFSFATSVDVLEHLPVEIRSKAIEELVRVAENGVLIAFPCGLEARKVDENFYHSLVETKAPIPEWLDEHLRQGYPEMEEVRNELMAAAQKNGLRASVSVYFSESIKLTKLLRRVAVRSRHMYVIFNFILGVFAPVMPRVEMDESYRAILFAEFDRK